MYVNIFFRFKSFLKENSISRDMVSTGNNSINNTTRWVSKLMKTSEFYKDYQHFYISGTTTTTSEEYFMYKTPPTRMYNWQWGPNPSDFQPENGVYQCTRAANFSSLYEIHIKKNPLRKKSFQFTSKSTSPRAEKQDLK